MTRHDFSSWVIFAWRAYTNIVGVVAIAAAVSLIVIRVFEIDGPVVEVTEAPVVMSNKISYKGVLSYRISTRRLASCDGVSVFTFRRDSPRIAVVITRPVLSTEIRPVVHSIVHIELPESVYPGKWMFQAVVDSTCPTHLRQDVTAQFEIEVLHANIGP